MKRTLLTSLLIITLFTLFAQTDADIEIGVIEKLDQYIHDQAMMLFTFQPQRVFAMNYQREAFREQGPAIEPVPLLPKIGRDRELGLSPL